MSANLTVTLSELAAALPHYSPEIIGTGGNIVALSLTVRGVPLLISLGDGTEQGDTYAIATDYAGRPDMDDHQGTCTSLNDVTDVVDGFVASRIWSDENGTPRVSLYGTDAVVDAATDWESDRIIARHSCRRCGEWLYVDNSRRSFIYRSESDGSSLCNGPTVGAHEGAPSYWIRTDAL